MTEIYTSDIPKNAKAAAPIGAPQPQPDLEEMTPQRSIVPRGSVAGTALVSVIAIMAFLSSLTLGAVSLVSDTAKGWQSDISREATIQVLETQELDINDALMMSRQIAGSFPGVESVSVLDEPAMERLMEPWLGNGLDLQELPVPRLVVLTLSKENPPDLTALRERIRAEVPGGSLDDHRAWVDRLTTMAQATISIGAIIFILMMVATVLTVVFATRGAMAGNRHVIEVLHFVGADQSYIADQFQKHFLMLGLKGALAGGITAIFCFLIIGYWAGQNVADPAADQVTALFGTFSVGLSGYIGTLTLIVVIAFLTALTARFTVFRHMGMLDGGSRRL